MNNNKTQKSTSTWNKMVHATFKKVVAYDLICIGIGVVIGIGFGVFVIKEVVGA